MENFVEHPRETPVENPMKPHDHAAKSIKENPANNQKVVHGTAESSTIEGGNKNGLDPVREHQEQGLATSLDPTKNHKEGLPVMVPQNKWHLEDPDFATFFLETAQRDYEHAIHMRTYYAKNARKHGITNKRIGQIYSLTEGAIRKMLKRAGDK